MHAVSIYLLFFIRIFIKDTELWNTYFITQANVTSSVVSRHAVQYHSIVIIISSLENKKGFKRLMEYYVFVQ